jgi:hypothetical protein
MTRLQYLEQQLAERREFLKDYYTNTWEPFKKSLEEQVYNMLSDQGCRGIKKVTISDSYTLTIGTPGQTPDSWNKEINIYASQDWGSKADGTYVEKYKYNLSWFSTNINANTPEEDHLKTYLSVLGVVATKLDELVNWYDSVIVSAIIKKKKEYSIYYSAIDDVEKQISELKAKEKLAAKEARTKKGTWHKIVDRENNPTVVDIRKQGRHSYQRGLLIMSAVSEYYIVGISSVYVTLKVKSQEEVRDLKITRRIFNDFIDHLENQ